MRLQLPPPRLLHPLAVFREKEHTLRPSLVLIGVCCWPLFWLSCNSYPKSPKSPSHNTTTLHINVESEPTIPYLCQTGTTTGFTMSSSALGDDSFKLTLPSGPAENQSSESSSTTTVCLGEEVLPELRALALSLQVGLVNSG